MKKYLLITLSFIVITFPLFAQNTIGGIGAQLFQDTSGGHTMPRVLSLVPNSPAYDSLKATDFLIKVNDISCKDKELNDVVAMIRGVAGTKVKITVADTKEGARPREYMLTRVGIQLAAPPDPAPAFNQWCDAQVKQLRKKGHESVKTYTSDCGNYFFNFNADTGTYYVRVYTMEEKGSGTFTPGFTATAKVYDGDKESNAIALKAGESAEANGTVIAQLEGTITFRRECVGIVSISNLDDAKKCKAMYIAIYR